MTACFNNSDDDNDMNYARLVDKDAEFIGKGIKVGFADAKWDWYLPDLNSTAQMISKKYVRAVSRSECNTVNELMRGHYRTMPSLVA